MERAIVLKSLSLKDILYKKGMTGVVTKLQPHHRVVIADDHKLLRHAVRDILGKTPSYEIVGEASNAEEAIKVVAKERPDILILDLGLPLRSGLDVILELRRAKLDVKIVVLSMYEDEAKVKQALSNGANGYLLKDFSPEQFSDALTTVISGKVFVPQKFSHLAGTPHSIATNGTNGHGTSNDPLSALSPREREMFFLIVDGLPNRTIAKKLFISPRTVETHRARVIKKLQLASNADLVRYAIKHGLVVV